MSGSYKLVVDVPFQGYQRGDQISDGTTISGVQNSDNARYVVQTSLTSGMPVGVVAPPVLSPYYVLPIAGPTTLGGVMVGSGLAIGPTGTLSVSYSYTLPISAPGVLGGIKPGTGITITADGTANVTVSGNSGATALSGLTDVHETSTTAGQYLQYNGTQWVNATPAAVPTALSQLTNDVGFISSVPLGSSTVPGRVQINTSANQDGSALAVNGSGVVSLTQTTVPTAALLGGTGGALAAVTVGSGLNLTGGTLSATYAYTLPPASGITLGGVIVGSGLSIDPTSHVLSATAQAASVAPLTQTVLGVAVPAGVASFVDVEVYTPANGDTRDVWIGSIQFKASDAVGGKFTYEVWAGTPHTTGTLIQPGGTALSVGTTTASVYGGSIYVPNSTGSDAVWVRIINQTTAAFTVNVQSVVLEVATSIPQLAGYTPPPPYSGPPLAVVNVGAGQQFADPSTGITALAVNGTMNIYDGSYYLPFDVPPTLTGITIKAVNRGKVTFDGRGGNGAGYRLAWGKSFVHTRAPCVIDGIWFQNCGGADGIGDQEAAIYAENFSASGTVTVQYCKFDGNEVGVASPSYSTTNGANVNVLISHCDFAQSRGNGVTPDGRSHDIYAEAQTLTVQNSNFYGGAGTVTYGNNIKSRSMTTSVSGCYIAHNNGRCLDIPDGGTLSVSSCTLTAVQGAVSNFIGYANESTLNGVSNPTLNLCTIIGTRFQDTIWVQPAGCVMAFTNCTQQWFNPNNIGPSFQITGNGSVTGLVLTPPAGTTMSSIAPAAPASASGW